MRFYSVLLAYFSLAAAQQIYIDRLPDYSLLDACAENPLSTVVRDMYSGCGDGGVYTSYSCFCTASSSYMAGVISTAVLSYCPGSTADASSATAVFHEYCQENATATASSMGSSVTPAVTNSTVSSSTASAASSTSSASSQSSSGLSSGAKAAIGVIVPVVVLSVLLAVFIMMRRKSHQRKQADQHFPEDNAPAYEEHLPRDTKDSIVEVPGSTSHALEMPIGKEHGYYVQEFGVNERKVQPAELQ
ncbi:hypothetical protein LTR10_021528 [Elasticomyces elasticus]|uniref:Extracellular membrane protein CFEM domain-containing protein n=1 Tax=Exophiala sideris TaxID=1016849 RepID=A0ABR0JAA7_9EURO|nr:hypothetical protein LTR10_021528 [Elasticomyces elasticus]KAK5027984.1 hypothetical protein LTS07_006860 [Exophiala sideris]KAK5037425.1 hypothetical protein LTR13_004582 [Exophiala sideris]KAK5059087.1 hypothetical protein LTR69_006376 [Exophiala sideris]KAK5182920.1 hypothetical protein LTR44_004630 [Eurotiomycetes sp. CCFEE 6388]